MKNIKEKLVHWSLYGVLAGSLFLGSAGVSFAEESTEQKLKELEQQIKVLQRKWEVEQEAATAKAAKTDTVKVGKDGISLKSADGDVQLRIGGDAQADGRFFLNDTNHAFNDTFLLRRIRLNFEGKFAKNFDFQIRPDFGAGTTVLQDAYVGYTYSPEFRIRVGKFKEPFGLERLQSATSTSFVEYGIPTSLTPNRNLGIQLFGDLAEGKLSYATGVFNGVVDNGSTDTDTNDQKDIVGRIFIHPFKDSVWALEGFGIGFAASTGVQKGNATTTNLTSGYKSPGQNNFFTYRSGAFAGGRNKRWSPQAYYYWNSLGLLGEYIKTAQKVETAATTHVITNSGWQVVASYVLTGEDASYKGVKPKGTWGAFELVGRYGELKIDKGAFSTFSDPTVSAQEAKAAGLGFNWYINQNFKFQTNYELTNFTGGATTGNRKSEHVVISRFQTAF